MGETQKVDVREYHKRRAQGQLDILNSCSQEGALELIMSGIRLGLAQLANIRPSGDDEVFDYYPNALDCLLQVYREWSEHMEGTQSQYKMGWYSFQHLAEECSESVVTDIHAALAWLGITLTGVWEEDAPYYLCPVEIGFS